MTTDADPRTSGGWNRLRLALRRILASNAVGLLLLLGAIGLAVATGIVGVGRPKSPESGMDMAYFYGSGRCWLRGLNAYDPATLDATADVFLDGSFFFYPPQIGPLAVLLASFRFGTAKILMWGINLAAAGGLAWLCLRMLGPARASPTPEPSPQARWLIPAAIFACPFLSHILFMGQSSLLASVALVGGWMLLARGLRIAGGILIGFATMKPQLALLPIVWLILEFQWKSLLAGGVTALLASVPAMRVSGPVGAFRDWLGTLERVPLCPDSAPGAPHLFSLQNVLVAEGLRLPSFLPLAIAAALLLWWYRRQFDSEDVLPLLFGATMLLGVASDYDLIVLVPMIPAFWRHFRERDLAALAAGLLLGILYLPQRPFASFGSPLLLHFRVLVVLGLTIWLLLLSLRERRLRPEPAAAPGTAS